MSRKLLLIVLALSVLGAACSQIGGTNIVPTTGDTANDASAVQRFIPNLSSLGYTSVQASDIQTALSSVSGGASLLTGNPAAAALVAQIDGMVSCYRNVGAFDARIYYQSNITTLIQGQIPSVGALAVVNENRLINNFLSCALNGRQAFGAQSESQGSQPCSGSGSIVVDGETIAYLYAATDTNLCNYLSSPFSTSK